MKVVVIVMMVVSIDRIGVIDYPADTADYCGNLEFMLGMASDQGCKVWKKKYSTYAMVPLGGTQTLRITAGVTHQKLYVKYDFNPASLTEDQWGELAVNLSCMLPYGYASLYHQGNVSYLEIAADCTEVQWGSFLPFDSKLTNSSWYPPYPASKATAYLGRRGSTRVIRAYDRVERLKAQGIVVNGPVTRIEAVARRLERRMSELVTLKNQFNTMGICSVNEAMNAHSEPHWKDFIQNSRRDGVPKALQLASSLRKVYLKRLQKLNCLWWDPAEVWNQYPTALQVLKSPMTLGLI
jgi:hypothetical protein